MQIHLQRCICIMDQAKGKIWDEEICKEPTCRGENRNLDSDFRRREEALGVANIWASLWDTEVCALRRRVP